VNLSEGGEKQQNFPRDEAINHEKEALSPIIDKYKITIKNFSIGFHMNQKQKTLVDQRD